MAAWQRWKALGGGRGGVEQRRLPRLTPDELLRCSPKDLTKRRLDEIFKVDAQGAGVVMDADGDRDQQHHQETVPQTVGPDGVMMDADGDREQQHPQETLPQTVGPAESGWGVGAVMAPPRGMHS